MDLEQLLCAVRDGDEARWRELEGALGRELRRYFGRRFGGDDVEELSRVTIVRVFERLRGLEPTRSLTAWVMGVARNVAMDEFRRRYADAELLARLGELDPARGPGPSTRVRNKQQLGLVLAEAEHLPEHLRRTLEHDLAEGDDRDFAEGEKIAVKTVHSRRSKAHAQLREQVERQRKTRSSQRS